MKLEDLLLPAAIVYGATVFKPQVNFTWENPSVFGSGTTNPLNEYNDLMGWVNNTLGTIGGIFSGGGGGGAR